MTISLYRTQSRISKNMTKATKSIVLPSYFLQVPGKQMEQLVNVCTSGSCAQSQLRLNVSVGQRGNWEGGSVMPGFGIVQFDKCECALKCDNL